MNTNNKAKHNAVWTDQGDEIKVWADGGAIWFERPENPNTPEIANYEVDYCDAGEFFCVVAGGTLSFGEVES